MRTYVYAGLSARTGGSISGLFRRAPDSDRWNAGALPGDTHVHAITIHPDDPQVLYAATSSGLYRSRDQGMTWTRLVEPAAGEQMWSVLIHPSDHRVILTGCAPLGLYRSDDAGETWRRMPRPRSVSA
ncbi:MAG: WD40/YVTN/BNR-like repeat-containing protein [Acetobacteraceae bacterium]